MSLALQSLVALTLLVSAAVAGVPLLLSTPQARPDPGAPAGSGPVLRVVEAPGGRWFLRGESIGRSSLATLLRSGKPWHRVDYLPSSALAMAQVSASLRWLRSVNPGGAVIGLPPAAPGLPR